MDPHRDLIVINSILKRWAQIKGMSPKPWRMIWLVLSRKCLLLSSTRTKRLVAEIRLMQMACT